jgi:hypothetical protein
MLPAEIPLMPGNKLELGAPPGRSWNGQSRFREDQVGHLGHQVILAADVTVQRHGSHAEFRCDTSHGHGSDAFGVCDRDGGSEEIVTVQ